MYFDTSKCSYERVKVKKKTGLQNQLEGQVSRMKKVDFFFVYYWLSVGRETREGEMKRKRRRLIDLPVAVVRLQYFASWLLRTKSGISRSSFTRMALTFGVSSQKKARSLVPNASKTFMSKHWLHRISFFNTYNCRCSRHKFDYPKEISVISFDNPV